MESNPRAPRCPDSPDPAVRLDASRLDALRRIDPGLVERVVAAYAQQVPEMLASLEAAAEGADLDALARSSHAFKSASGTVGAVQVERLAARIERDARAGRRDAAQGSVARMRTASDLALQALKREPVGE